MAIIILLAHLPDSLVRVSRRVKWCHRSAIVNSQCQTSQSDMCFYAVILTYIEHGSVSGMVTHKQACEQIQTKVIVELTDVYMQECSNVVYWKWTTIMNRTPHHKNHICTTKMSHLHILSTIVGSFKSLSKVLFTFPSWYLPIMNLNPICCFMNTTMHVCIPIARNVIHKTHTVPNVCKQAWLSHSMLLCFKNTCVCMLVVACHDQTTQYTHTVYQLEW